MYLQQNKAWYDRVTVDGRGHPTIMERRDVYPKLFENLQDIGQLVKRLKRKRAQLALSGTIYLD